MSATGEASSEEAMSKTTSRLEGRKLHRLVVDFILLSLHSRHQSFAPDLKPHSKPFGIPFHFKRHSSLTLAATRFGVSSLAAHNVLLRIFFFFSTFGDSLSQSVQNFLPAVFTMNKNPTSKAYKRFEGFHIACAGVVGLLFSVVSSVFTRSKAGASVFTTSPPILKLIAECAPFLSLSLVVHPFVMIMEGAIIAKRDTNFLLFTYGVTFTALLTSMKTASSLKGVWTGFLGFQLLRCVQFGIRVLMRRNKEVVYVRVK